MLKPLCQNNIDQVAKIHQKELSGFLSQLGVRFLEKFYRVSLDISEMFTYIDENQGKVMGFVSGIENPRGLNKKVIMKEPFGFIYHILRYFITHPTEGVKIVKTLTYPGFTSNSPELLSIAVSKAYQKKGIGKKLFEKVIQEFRERGYDKFKISVYDRLEANGFYQKMGCKKITSFLFLGEEMNYYLYSGKENGKKTNQKLK